MPNMRIFGRAGSPNPEARRRQLIQERRDAQASMRQRTTPVHDQQAPAVAAPLHEKDRKTLKEIFLEQLHGKLDRIPNVRADSELKDIDGITIINPEGQKKGEEALNVLVTYKQPDGKMATAFFTLSDSQDALLLGKVPKDLPYTKEQLAFEVMRIVQNLHIEALQKIDEEPSIEAIAADAVDVALPEVHEITEPIFPDKDIASTPAGIGNGKKTTDRRLDLERFEPLAVDPQLLFIFVSKEKGFDGYHGFVMPHCVILEHATVTNAAFVVKLPEPIPVDDERLQRPPGERFDADEIDGIVKKYLRVVFEYAKTKKALQERQHVMRVARVVHGPRWKERMIEQIVLSEPEIAA